MHHELTLHDIYLARQRIAGLVLRTPLVRSESLSQRWNCEVWLKLDNLQPTGAFKLRGATNALLGLDTAQRARGVVTMSTGNFGRALAYAGRHLSIPVTVCISRLVPENKVEALRQSGAELVIHGEAQDEADVEARRLRDEQGLAYVSPFDDPLVIAGQGTCGLEIMEEQPDTDLVFAGLSGGGLIAGVGLAVKAINPRAEVIGVSMNQGAAMLESLAAGHPVQVPEVASLADSLGGGIGLDNAWTFAMTQRYMDRGYKVDETQIARAMLHFLHEEKMLVEGAAAVGVAAVEQYRLDLSGRRVALVVSGQNLSNKTFAEACRLAGERPYADL
ncbi:hydroxyectoine utilization dehydratase EutB [Pseudomonas sp. MMS21-TM103]|uniref:hydroxyectoine utilization dehydratase EutB n=1 Tax=Pseudomonas sp. MMS21 TM103 TaxID=2886506 RepID=UPI001EDFEBF7|nr:hydroxyectoine utilization dehydratase EutB [Pseudomonas sp. MMS21 TM103]MCG4452737.1 hydroxyectoine utilization dehydratase EutB [Pseudomonas sp. MMS21 TM103]